MMKIREKIYVDASDLEKDEIYDKFPEIDYLYEPEYLNFYGTPERLQEVYRYCDARGFNPRREK